LKAYIIIEFLATVGMVANAVLFIPQIHLLLKKKDSSELSFILFFGFNLIQLTSLLHGWITNDMLLFYGMAMSLISCGIVSILILYYRYFN
jgi:MtN3 and saliva related transmembrane protein